MVARKRKTSNKKRKHRIKDYSNTLAFLFYGLIFGIPFLRVIIESGAYFILIPVAIAFLVLTQKSFKGFLFLTRHKLILRYRTQKKWLKPVLIISLLLLVFKFSLFTVRPTKPLELQEENGEFSEYIEIEDKDRNVFDTIAKHNRIWYANNNSKYEMSFEAKHSDLIKSKYHKRRSRLMSQVDYGKLYKNIADFDTMFMTSLLNKLNTFRFDGKQNIHFARTLVSFIQDIPYVLILPKDCDASLYKSEFVTEYLNGCNNCCKGNVYGGVQSIAQTMYDLKADCDSRTLFLYTVFNYFGFKVCIMNSEEYGHSILGVAINGTGSNKFYDGRIYYAWETTSKGYDIGQLSPKINNMEHWDIVLAN